MRNWFKHLLMRSGSAKQEGLVSQHRAMNDVANGLVFEHWTTDPFVESRNQAESGVASL